MELQAREIRTADVVRIPMVGEIEVARIESEPGLVRLCAIDDQSCERAYEFAPSTRLDVKRPGSLFGEPEDAPAAQRETASAKAFRELDERGFEVINGWPVLHWKLRATALSDRDRDRLLAYLAGAGRFELGSAWTEALIRAGIPTDFKPSLDQLVGALEAAFARYGSGIAPKFQTVGVGVAGRWWTPRNIAGQVVWERSAGPGIKGTEGAKSTRDMLTLATQGGDLDKVRILLLGRSDYYSTGSGSIESFRVFSTVSVDTPPELRRMSKWWRTRYASRDAKDDRAEALVVAREEGASVPAPGRGARMTRDMSRDVLVAELQRRGWTYSERGRYEYVTSPSDTVRVQIKERNIRLQERLGPYAKPGQWDRSGESLGSLKSLVEKRLNPTLARLEKLEADHAEALAAREVDLASEAKAVKEKREAERAGTHETAKVEGEVVVRYSRPEGILACGATYENRAKIKASAGPKKWKFSRRLPDDCAWYVPRSRDQDYTRATVERYADALRKAGIEKVRVDYTPPGSVTPDVTPAVETAIEQAKVQAELAKQAAIEQREHPWATAEQARQIARDHMAEEREIQAKAQPADERDPREEAFELVEMLKKAEQALARADEATGRASGGEAAEKAAERYRKARDKVEALEARLAKAQAKAESAGYTDAMAAEDARLPTEQRSEVALERMERVYRKWGMAGLRKLRAAIRKAVSGPHWREYASQLAAQAVASVALRQGAWPPAPERGDTYSPNEARGVVAALESDPLIKRARELLRTFDGQLSDVLVKAGAATKIGVPLGGARSPKYPDLMIGIWDGARAELPTATVASYLSPIRAPDWMATATPADMAKVRDFLRERAQDAIKDADVLLNPAIWRDGPSTAKVELCKVSTRLAETVLRRLYEVPFEWGREGDQQASDLCADKVTLKDLRDVRDKKDREEKDRAARYEGLLRQEAIERVIPALRNPEHRESKAKFHNALRRAGYSFKHDAKASTPWGVQLYQAPVGGRYKTFAYLRLPRGQEMLTYMVEIPERVGESEALQALYAKLMREYQPSQAGQELDALEALVEKFKPYLSARDLDAGREHVRIRLRAMLPEDRERAERWIDGPRLYADDWLAFRNVLAGAVGPDGDWPALTREQTKRLAQMQSEVPRIVVDMPDSPTATILVRVVRADGTEEVVDVRRGRGDRTKPQFAAGLGRQYGIPSAPVYSATGAVYFTTAKRVQGAVTGYGVICEGPLEVPAESQCFKAKALSTARKAARDHAEAWGRRARIVARRKNVSGEELEVIEPPDPSTLTPARRKALVAKARNRLNKLVKDLESQTSEYARTERQAQIVALRSWLDRLEQRSAGKAVSWLDPVWEPMANNERVWSLHRLSPWTGHAVFDLPRNRSGGRGRYQLFRRISRGADTTFEPTGLTFGTQEALVAYLADADNQPKVAAREPKREAPSVAELEERAKRGEVIALTGPGSLAEAVSQEQAQRRAAREAAPAPVVDEKAEAKRAAKLKAKAEKMRAKAKRELSAERNENTERRARMASSVRSRASAELVMADVLERVAGARVPYVRRIQSLAELDALDRELRQARDLRGRKRNIPWDRLRYEAPTIEDVPFAEFKVPKLSSSRLPGELLAQSKGLGELSLPRSVIKRLEARVTGPQSERETWDLSETEMNAIWTVDRAIKKAKGNSPLQSLALEDWIADYRRLKGLGIEDTATLREALRAYLGCCRGGKAPPPPDPIKAKEQALMRSGIVGFYPTPKALVERMVADAKIKPGDRVLEPSAGSGAIAEVVRDKHPTAELNLVEFNVSLAELLRAKGFAPIQDDFLRWSQKHEGGTYDAIIMNPPFEKRADTAHISRALEILAPGGRLVAIASGSFPSRTDLPSVRLREQLQKLGATIEPLPAGTFAQAGTNVSTVLITAERPAVRAGDRPRSTYCPRGSFAELAGCRKDLWVDVKPSQLASRPEVLENMHQLITTAYAPLGGHLKFRKPSDLTGDETLLIVAADIDDDPEADVVSLGKRKRRGVKSTGLGHDGSRPAKDRVIAHKGEMLNRAGNYGELSDAIAHLMITRYGVPAVTDPQEVAEILGKQIEWVGAHPEGKYPEHPGWYYRTIAGKRKLKILLGKPLPQSTMTLQRAAQTMAAQEITAKQAEAVAAGNTKGVSLEEMRKAWGQYQKRPKVQDKETSIPLGQFCVQFRGNGTSVTICPAMTTEPQGDCPIVTEGLTRQGKLVANKALALCQPGQPVAYYGRNERSLAAAEAKRRIRAAGAALGKKLESNADLAVRKARETLTDFEGLEMGLRELVPTGIVAAKEQPLEPLLVRSISLGTKSKRTGGTLPLTAALAGQEIVIRVDVGNQTISYADFVDGVVQGRYHVYLGLVPYGALLGISTRLSSDASAEAKRIGLTLGDVREVMIEGRPLYYLKVGRRIVGPVRANGDDPSKRQLSAFQDAIKGEIAAVGLVDWPNGTNRQNTVQLAIPTSRQVLRGAYEPSTQRYWMAKDDGPWKLSAPPESTKLKKWPATFYFDEKQGGFLAVGDVLAWTILNKIKEGMEDQPPARIEGPWLGLFWPSDFPKGTVEFAPATGGEIDLQALADAYRKAAAIALDHPGRREWVKVAGLYKKRYSWAEKREKKAKADAKKRERTLAAAKKEAVKAATADERRAGLATPAPRPEPAAAKPAKPAKPPRRKPAAARPAEARPVETPPARVAKFAPGKAALRLVYDQAYSPLLLCEVPRGDVPEELSRALAVHRFEFDAESGCYARKGSARSRVSPALINALREKIERATGLGVAASYMGKPLARAAEPSAAPARKAPEPAKAPAKAAARQAAAEARKAEREAKAAAKAAARRGGAEAKKAEREAKAASRRAAADAKKAEREAKKAEREAKKAARKPKDKARPPGRGAYAVIATHSPATFKVKPEAAMEKAKSTHRTREAALAAAKRHVAKAVLDQMLSGKPQPSYALVVKDGRDLVAAINMRAPAMDRRELVKQVMYDGDKYDEVTLGLVKLCNVDLGHRIAQAKAKRRRDGSASTKKANGRTQISEAQRRANTNRLINELARGGSL
jgi:phospholipid N-methyltransferase